MDSTRDGELRSIMKQTACDQQQQGDNTPSNYSDLIQNSGECPENRVVSESDGDSRMTTSAPPHLEPSVYQDDKSSGVVYQLFYSGQNGQSEPLYHMSPASSIHTPRADDPGLQNMQTVPVSCGSISGKMYLHMFTCPGIHQPCIEYEGHILSPKQFTIQGEKERQKDWKASIRIGKSSLRAHMEAGTFDFYDHANRCSGKCQSRNYVNAPIDRAEVILMRKAKRNADQVYLRQEIDLEMNGSIGSENNDGDVANERRDGTLAPPGRKARGRPRGSSNKNRTIKKEDLPTENYFDYFEGRENTDPQIEQEKPDDCSPFYDVLNCLQYDPQHFWTQMQSTGVISHFCDDIIVHAINLKQASLTPSQMTSQTANMLTRVAFAFGIQSLVVQRVQNIERSVHQRRKHEEMLQEMANKNGNSNQSDSQNPIGFNPNGESYNVEEANEFLVPNDYMKEVVKYEDEIEPKNEEEFQGDASQFIENTGNDSYNE